MDKQREGGERMSAPGHLTAQTGRNQAQAGADQGVRPADALDRMITLAREARSEETWAYDALSRFVAGCAEGRLDPLVAVAAGSGVDAARERLLEVLDQIVHAGHDEGSLRADVGTGDVVGVVGLLVRALPTVPAGVGEELRERAVRLVLAGMRAHPAPVPPGEPLTADALTRRATASHDH
ncbi:hypothetical protein ACWEPC_00270 [Nonomuraea sp. NPDC004297]